MTLDPELFNWWAICISSSIVFMTSAGIYIYADSKRTAKTKRQVRTNPITLAKDFVFVWVLFGLLALYIVSINAGSSMLFAAGNILTEVALIIYAVENRTGLERNQ